MNITIILLANRNSKFRKKVIIIQDLDIYCQIYRPIRKFNNVLKSDRQYTKNDIARDNTLQIRNRNKFG